MHEAPRRPLLFTARALAQLRKLAAPHQAEARRLCERLEEDPCSVSKKLAGNAGVWRARLKTSDVRIGWALDSDDSPVVFWAALKGADDSYRRVKDRAAGLSHQPSLRLATDLWLDDDLPVDTHGDEVPDVPAYRRSGSWDDWGWRSMLYGGYTNSPRLVRRQENDFRDIIWHGGNPAEECAVVRGGAGSGKSVCGLLWACRLGSGEGGQGEHHVVYVAPEALVDRFRAFPEVADRLAPPTEHILTLMDWFGSLAPEAPPVNEERLVDVFNNVLRRTQWGRSRDAGRARYEDLLLYEAFVVGGRHAKDAAADEHADRVAELAAVDPDAWTAALAEHEVSSRAALARAVRGADLTPPAKARALIVVDEAQDLLIEELLAVRDVWRAWNAAGCETRLWLFGDLNQRITPSGFTWADLNRRVGIEDAPRDLDKNYRNVASVLGLAARVHGLGQRMAQEAGRRHLPPPSMASVGTLDGDAVGVVRVHDAVEAARFVASLHENVGSGDPEQYLRSHLARRAQILAPARREDIEATGAVMHYPRTVKGSELDAAVAVDIFSAGVSGRMGLQDVNAAYTLVTRVRSRLLLLLTEPEYDWAVEGGLLEDVVLYEEEAAREWVMGLASAVDLAASPEAVFQRLCALSPAGRPWLDTWEVLVESGQAHRAGEWEAEVANDWTADVLVALMSSAVPWLRAMVCIRLGRLAEAEDAITTFVADSHSSGQHVDDVATEAGRLVGSLAGRYERANRPYEAHRLRTRMLSGYVPPPSLPLPEVKPHGPLVPAVLSAVENRLLALIERQP